MNHAITKGLVVHRDIKPENFVLIISGVFSLFLITVFELIPVKIDDNLFIPLIFGILFSLLTKTDFLI